MRKLPEETLHSNSIDRGTSATQTVTVEQAHLLWL